MDNSYSSYEEINMELVQNYLQTLNLGLNEVNKKLLKLHRNDLLKKYHTDGKTLSDSEYKRITAMAAKVNDAYSYLSDNFDKVLKAIDVFNRRPNARTDTQVESKSNDREILLEITLQDLVTISSKRIDSIGMIVNVPNYYTYHETYKDNSGEVTIIYRLIDNTYANYRFYPDLDGQAVTILDLSKVEDKTVRDIYGNILSIDNATSYDDSINAYFFHDKGLLIQQPLTNKIMPSVFIVQY